MAIIAVAPTGKASLVYNYVQTSLVFVLKPQRRSQGPLLPVPADNCDKSYSKMWSQLELSEDGVLSTIQFQGVALENANTKTEFLKWIRHIQEKH